MMLVHDLASIPYQVDKYLFYLLFVCNQAQRNVGKREVYICQRNSGSDGRIKVKISGKRCLILKKTGYYEIIVILFADLGEII